MSWFTPLTSKYLIKPVTQQETIIKGLMSTTESFQQQLRRREDIVCYQFSQHNVSELAHVSRPKPLQRKKRYHNLRGCVSSRGEILRNRPNFPLHSEANLATISPSTVWIFPHVVIEARENQHHPLQEKVGGLSLR